ERLTIHFCKTLGRAKHGHGLDRFIGRYHYHRRSARRCRRISDVDRSKYVGLDAFVPIPLKHRNVLERSRVEDNIRLELRDETDDLLAVADVGNPPQNLGGTLLGLQCLQNSVQRRLGVLDHQQPASAESDYTIADFGTDRAAATGNDNSLCAYKILK